MKSCSSCGASNIDSDRICGVCGGTLNEAFQKRIQSSNPALKSSPSRIVHKRGLASLAVSLVTLASGIVLLEVASVLGLFMLLLGFAGTGSVFGFFRGLPYQPNSGWHRGGDPDLAATNSMGSLPSNYAMMEVDRRLESKRKSGEND